MTEVGTLAITLPTLIAIFGAILAWQNYKLNKKKDARSDTQEEVSRRREEDEHNKNIDVQLTAMAKDIQYIRMQVDKIEAHDTDHERRITALENKCKSFAGGKQK